MESKIPSHNPTIKKEEPLDDSLPSELLEKELQALERFQKLLITIHSQYKSVLGDITAATNGEIIQYLRILPSVVKEQTKDLLTMKFRTQGYTIFSGFEHTRRLITRGIETIRRGLEDFYTVADAILVEKEKGAGWAASIDAKLLDIFLASKEAKRVELEDIEMDITTLEGEFLLLKVELDMVMTSCWKCCDIVKVETKEEYPKGELRSQYLEAIAEKHKFMIRVLQSHFEFAFSTLEKLVEPTMRFNFNPRAATIFKQHPTRVPYELQEKVNKVPNGFNSSNPALVINELSDAVMFVQNEYEKAHQIIVGYYKSGIATGKTDGQPIARVQKTIHTSTLVKQLDEWDFMLYAIQLAYARAEIERYCQEIEKTEKNVPTKAESEMEKEAEDAMEEMLLFMMDVERDKEDLMGSHYVKQEKLDNMAERDSGTKKRNEYLRKLVKQMVSGAERWKKEQELQNKMNDAFSQWQHLHPEGGGTDGFMKALGLENWEKEHPTREKLSEIVEMLGIKL